jgi:hypothetical protein
MGFTVAKFNKTKKRMLGKFNKALAEAEALRKAELDVAAGGAATAQEIAEKKPETDGTSQATVPVPLPDTR